MSYCADADPSSARFTCHNKVLSSISPLFLSSLMVSNGADGLFV
jgi:hypothetical protein